jgi:hypothetical protein
MKAVFAILLSPSLWALVFIVAAGLILLTR